MTRNAAHDRASFAVGAAFLLLYGFTAAPGLLFADSAELQTVAILGGIPHSTGYPLWVALAHAFTWLPIGAPEFRVTVFSALCGAVALALLVRRLGEMGVGFAASLAAACFLGLSFSFWRVSQRAEVYTLTLVVALVALGALLRVRADAGGSPRPARVAAVLLGLVLTGHLGFAPPVAVAGLALAWRELRAGRSLARPLALLGLFLLGLTPYLMLLGLDAAHVPANFLDLVRHAKSLLPPGGPPIDTPASGVWWLVTGRNIYPPQPMAFHPRSMLTGLGDCGAVLFLFELGPAALVLAVIGIVRRWRRDRALAFGLLAAFASSMVFAAALQSGAMLHLFQLPAILVGAILVADGLDATIGLARTKVRVPAAVTALVLLAALAIPPAELRVHAASHPIGSRGWQVSEEDRALHTGLVPSMRGERRAEAWARTALDSIPPDALVMATWSDFTPLRHLRLVEGRRRDLTLDQIAGETLDRRVREWQASHDLRDAPLVFAARGPREAPYLTGADSIAMPDGRFVFVLRAPAALKAEATSSLNGPIVAAKGSGIVGWDGHLHMSSLTL